MVAGLSVIVRYHNEGSIELLKDALFSISVQTYSNIQVIVACQNVEKEKLRGIQTFLKKLPFQETRPAVISTRAGKTHGHILFNLKCGNRKDIRATLLNKGLACCRGRYVAFLDYDDVIYQHAYEKLIAELVKTHAAIAIGGTVRADLKIETKSLYAVNKKPYLSRTFNIFDFIIDNFIPIHSFVIDRKRIKKWGLKVNENLQAYEDYYLLLKLIFEYKTDYSLITDPICEYRFRDDNSNSTPIYREEHNKAEKWRKSRKIIDSLKAKLMLTFDARTLESLLKESKQNWDIFSQLKSDIQ